MLVFFVIFFDLLQGKEGCSECDLKREEGTVLRCTIKELIGVLLSGRWTRNGLVGSDGERKDSTSTCDLKLLIIQTPIDYHLGHFTAAIHPSGIRSGTPFFYKSLSLS